MAGSINTRRAPGKVGKIFRENTVIIPHICCDFDSTSLVKSYHPYCRFLLCIIVEISLRSVTFVAVFASLCNAQNGLSCRSSASGFTSCSRRQEDQHLTANSSTCTQWSFWSDDLQLWMKPWQQGINSLSTKFSRFRYIGMHKSGRYSFIAFKLPKLGLPHILEMCRLKNAHFLVIICVIVLGTALTLVCHAVSSSTVVYSNLE